MRPRVKTLWLDALRSGEYQQGMGLLRTTNDEFCCLGVLCDLAEKEGVISRNKDKDYPQYVYGKKYGATLPPEVQEWADLDSSVGNFPKPVEDVDDEGYRTKAYSLVDLNDGLDYNFLKIADVIEEQF